MELEQLETRLAKLESAIGKIVNVWMPAFRQRLEACEASGVAFQPGAADGVAFQPEAGLADAVARLEAGLADAAARLEAGQTDAFRRLALVEARVEYAIPTQRPYRRNWKDWVTVTTLRDSGMSIRKVSRLVKLAYTTCHNYCFLDERSVERLRAQWEVDNPPFGPGDIDPELFRG
jgi:hypothetical protein